MTITEIKTIESERQDSNQWNIIHLIKEGDFYRAHDWSAWLMSTYPIGEAVEKPLKVLAKKLKDGYVDAFLGFPASSIGKYVPNDGSIVFVPVSDNQIDVVIDMHLDEGEANYDNLNRMKEEWKEGLPLQEGKKQRREEREAASNAPRFMRMSDIIFNLVSLPIEDISPREAFDILRDLRKQAIALY